MVDVLGLVNIPWWLILAAVCYVIYYKMTEDHGRWKQRGIPGPKPVPLFGTMLPMLSKGFTGYDKEMCKYGKVAGGFDGPLPVLWVHDTEMLKEIMIKQFDCFVNRRPFEAVISCFKDMLTLINDDRWRKVRNHITPSFTSGKLKGMFPNIRQTANHLKVKLAEATLKDGKFNTRDMAGAYTMDVIALTAFGIEANALNETKDNDFIQHAYYFFEMFFNGLLMLMFFILPKTISIIEKLGLLKYLSNSNIDKAELFFRKITLSVMKEREKNPAAVRTDFISLCIDGNKQEIAPDKRLEMNEILAQALLFFIAGYETTQTTITFLSYNLALNPEAQEKLCAEIDELFPDKDKKVDYETLQKMTYFEQCLEESMRMYPPAIRVDRECNKDTTVKGVAIKKGEVVLIPIYSIHHDEEIYPEPMKFDPDRFSPETKETRSQFTWMPFGMGPRNCIGMRLALLEIRLAIVTILRTHKIVLTKDTVTPEKMTWKSGFNLTPKEPLYLALEPRD